MFQSIIPKLYFPHTCVDKSYVIEYITSIMRFVLSRVTS